MADSSSLTVTTQESATKPILKATLVLKMYNFGVHCIIVPKSTLSIPFPKMP